jgi:hypothetical protein
VSDKTIYGNPITGIDPATTDSSQHTLLTVSSATANRIRLRDPQCLECGKETVFIRCARCQQLADIEREIGRAVINNHIVSDIIYRLDQDWSNSTATNHAMSICDSAMLTKGGEITNLIARWRRLHAEGAE